MRKRTFLLAMTLCTVPVSAIAAVVHLDAATALPEAPTKSKAGVGGRLVAWQAPGKALTNAMPRFVAQMSNRAPDAAWTAKVKALAAKPALSIESAGKLIGEAGVVGDFSYKQKLGPYEGTRGQIKLANLNFDICIDFLNALMIMSIIQEGANSGVVKMGVGSEAELHLPAVGGNAVVRFNVDPSSSWSVQVDGAPESIVTVKSGAPEAVVSIDLAVQLTKGSPSEYTTVRLKSLGTSNLYNTEVAIAEFQ